MQTAKTSVKSTEVEFPILLLESGVSRLVKKEKTLLRTCDTGR